MKWQNAECVKLPKLQTILQKAAGIFEIKRPRSICGVDATILLYLQQRGFHVINEFCSGP